MVVASDDSKPAVPAVADVPAEELTLEVEFAEDSAERNIDQAVRGRRGVARKYVRWARRRNPDANPAQMIFLIERHYLRAISTAGAAITAGGIALDVGITMIPIVGPVAHAGKEFFAEAGKKVAKEGLQRGADVAMDRAARAAFAAGAVTRIGRIAGVLPAGDEQLQFEITALFVLALADIHGLDLDNAQATALVYGLSNGRVTQKQIATTARALAQSLDAENAAKVKRSPHWALTLASDLHDDDAKTLVRGIQTGSLDNIRSARDGKVKPIVEFGVGAIVDGRTRFIFGREVVDGSRSAFPDAPPEFPDHLGVESKSATEEDQSPAFEALKNASKAAGGTVATGAGFVGTHVTKAAEIASRPFRRIDRDGDGVAEDADALKLAKNVGGRASHLASAARARVTTRLKRDDGSAPNSRVE